MHQRRSAEDEHAADEPERGRGARSRGGRRQAPDRHDFEPTLTVVKQVSKDNSTYVNSLGGFDAGDTLYYRIVISNASGQPK